MRLFTSFPNGQLLDQFSVAAVPGKNHFTWTPKAAAGLLFYRLQGTSLEQTGKLLYLD